MSSGSVAAAQEYAARFTSTAQSRKLGTKNGNELKGNISFEKRTFTLGEILNGIERQSRYVFIYTDDELPVEQKFALDVPEQPIQVFLSNLFQSINVQYKLFGRQIVLSSIAKPDVKSSTETLPMAGGSPSAAEVIVLPNYAINDRIAALTVGGVVSDEEGNPLPGVNVLEKGSSNGAVTDVNGNFQLQLVDDNAVLVFSFIGYISKEVAVNGQSTINVSMMADIQTLSEVVVVGYGEQKRSDLTGSVGSVKADEIRNMPARSLNEAIQGKVAGVTITKNSGAPGSGSDIVIRGVGSINGMAPLYIVDGVRMGTGYNFNIQDIESIEILKDASAAAIYGSQAAGGVILVTTKRGTKDKMQINFNTYVGVRQPVNMYDLLGTPDYIRAKEAFGNDVSGWGNPSSLPNTNWVDELFGNGSDQSYSISLSGGAEKSNYYASASYQTEDGIRLDNSFKRYSLRLNSDYQLSSRFKVGETLYAWKGSFNPAENATIPFRSAPTQEVYDPTNPDGGWGKTPPYFAGGNPVGNELIHHRVDETYALEGNVYAEWKPLDGLTIRGTAGGAFIGHNDSDFVEAYNFGALANTNATFEKYFSKQENYTTNIVASYDKTFGKHQLGVMAGYEMYREDYTDLGGEASGFATPIAESFNLNNNLSSQRVRGGVLQNRRLLSQFGRINYTYNDKYILTANIRHDGNDRFAPKNRWGWFPSISGAWKISEEDFMAGVSFISSLKLRGGYGVLGNDGAISQFTYQGSYGSQNITGLPDGSRVVGYGLNPRVPNDEIKWEEVSTVDIGVDAGFLGNRLMLTVDYYSRQTNDMIYQLTVPNSAGLGNNVPVNIGQMSNKGVELTIDYRGKAGELAYQFGFNSAFNKNEVIKLDGVDNNPIDDGFVGEYIQGPVSRTSVGQPISQFYGYVVEGIYASDQEVANRGVTQTGAGAGDLIFQDIDGNGTINENDRTFIGNPWPKMTYGLSASLSWKGFDLSLLFQGVQGMDVYNGAKHFTQFIAGDYNTTADIFNASFFAGNELTSQPRVGFTNGSGDYERDPNGNYSRVSSYFVEDGSFLKLRNVQLGYSLPSSLNSRIGLTSARIYFMAQNLFMVTSYSGMDPEVVGSGTRAGTTSRGIDTFYSYPQTRLLSLGVDLTF